MQTGPCGAPPSAATKRILTWSDDGTARLWDAATGKEVVAALRHDADSAVWGAAFSRDESRILAWSEDGTARLWDVPACHAGT